MHKLQTNKIVAPKSIIPMDPFNHEGYNEEYVEYDEFKGVYKQLEGYDKWINKENKVDYHLWDRSLYMMSKLCGQRKKPYN